MPKSTISLIYITSRDEVEAKRVAIHLLRKRLIGCANIHPIKSWYWWKSKIAEGSEVVLIAKARKGNYGKIKREVKKIHSYQTPCIMKLSAEVNTEYGDWLFSEMK